MGRRIQARHGNGRFRRGTLADIGMACCPKCGSIYTPNLTSVTAPAGFVDPMLLAKARRACPTCDGGTGQATGLQAVTPAVPVADTTQGGAS